MSKRKFILSFFLLAVSFFCIASSSEIVFSQNDDKATVLNTQKKLQELGYNPGPLDGIWGKKTYRALKKFQHQNGLPATGNLDPITKEKLGIISPEKSVPKRKISINTLRDSVKDTFKSGREIIKVQIENDVLKVVSDFDFVNKEGYASTILNICRNTNVSDQVTQIWILNARENQGWVLLKAAKCCNQIRQAPSDQLDMLIFRYSADVLLFETK